MIAPSVSRFFVRFPPVAIPQNNDDASAGSGSVTDEELEIAGVTSTQGRSCRVLSSGSLRWQPRMRLACEDFHAFLASDL